jgi:cyclophilin family peptidyl-prolyl cis-trans isomerase
MKKLFFSIVAIFILSSNVSAQEITVVFPNGGEHFTENVAAPHNIIWTATGVTNFNVEYSTNNGSTWIPITTNITDNFLNWTPTVLSEQCLIKVTENGGTTTDESEAVFSIVNQHNYYAEWETSMGNFRVMLRNDFAPITSQNFINLAERNFYDGLLFHRIIENFMIQDGCPLGTGTGGPNYEFDNEISPLLTHGFAGVLSMANAGPNTNGSQYFITVDNESGLDGNYSVFGRVVDGMNIVYAISEVDTDGNDRPLVDVDIYSITISDAAPDLALSYPTGAESLIENSMINIEWDSEYLADVMIEFSSDNGSNWETLIDSIPADFSSYEWTLPNTFSTECIIKITDLNSVWTDQSGLFEIRVNPVKLSRIELYEGVVANSENEDNLVMIGKPLRFKVKLSNDFNEDLTNVTAVLTSTNSSVTISESSILLSSINQSEELWSDDYFEIILPSEVPNDGNIPLKISVSAENIYDVPWESEFNIPVLNLFSFVTIDDDNTPDSQGNENGDAEPDEIFEVIFPIQNKSTDTCYQVFGQLTSTVNYVDIWNNILGTDRLVYDTTKFNNLQPILPGSTYIQSENDFVFNYTADDSYQVPLILKVHGFLHGEEGIDFETGGVKFIWGLPYSINSSLPIGIDEEIQTPNSSLMLLENPTSGKIKFSYKSENNTDDFVMNIFDTAGKLIYSQKLKYNNSNIYQISDISLNNGIYILSIDNNGELLTEKLIVQ